MKSNLFFQAITKFLLGVIILGLLIFLPAGSLHYWQGWLLMGILFVPMFIAGLVMMAKTIITSVIMTFMLMVSTMKS